MNEELDKAEKYRWTFAWMSVGYFLLAWWWIGAGIRPTAILGTAWILLGAAAGSASIYLVRRHAETLRTAEEELVVEQPLTLSKRSSFATLHHAALTRTKVHS
jgi:hypothetical protein